MRSAEIFKAVHKPSSLVEQNYFANNDTKLFFKHWCETHNYLSPHFMPRPEWLARTGGSYLLPNLEGGYKLVLPQDLKIWEMVSVTREIDKKLNPNGVHKSLERKEATQELAENLKNISLYMAEYIATLDEGKETALGIAKAFYTQARLILGAGSLADQYPISEEQKAEVEKLIIGRVLEEKDRKKYFKKLFRAFAKALNLQAVSDKKSLDLEKVPIHTEFLAQADSFISKLIESPKTDLYASVFESGSESLKNLFAPSLVADAKEKADKLIERLDLHNLRADLEALRKSEASSDAIAMAEKFVVNHIHHEVSKFKGVETTRGIREIFEGKQFNCVGFALLSGLLLEAVGIDYLVIDWSFHTDLLFIYANGDIEMRNMNNIRDVQAITDEDIISLSEDNPPPTTQDIRQFSQDKSQKSFHLATRFDVKYSSLRSKKRETTVVSRPETTHRRQYLSNYGYDAQQKMMYGVSRVALEEALMVGNQEAYSFVNYGSVLRNLAQGEHDQEIRESLYAQAIFVSRRALQRDPNYTRAHLLLAHIYSDIKKYDMAETQIKKCIEMNPNIKEFYYFLAEISMVTKNYLQAEACFYKFLFLNKGSDQDKEKEATRLLNIAQEKILARIEAKHGPKIANQ